VTFGFSSVSVCGDPSSQYRQIDPAKTLLAGLRLTPLWSHEGSAACDTIFLQSTIVKGSVNGPDLAGVPTF
jgi:hypothetical protein